MNNNHTALLPVEQCDEAAFDLLSIDCKLPDAEPYRSRGLQILAAHRLQAPAEAGEVERVARALHQDHRDRAERIMPRTWDNLWAEELYDYRSQARAAITALRANAPAALASGAGDD